jgi:predicted Zn-dependent peptidase
LPKLARQEVVDFYHARYAPNGTVIAVVGDVTEAEAVQLLNRYFKGWKQSERRLPAPVSPPRIEKNIVRKINKDITQATSPWGILASAAITPTIILL